MATNNFLFNTPYVFGISDELEKSELESMFNNLMNKVYDFVALLSKKLPNNIGIVAYETKPPFSRDYPFVLAGRIDVTGYYDDGLYESCYMLFGIRAGYYAEYNWDLETNFVEDDGTDPIVEKINHTLALCEYFLLDEFKQASSYILEYLGSASNGEAFYRKVVE